MKLFIPLLPRAARGLLVGLIGAALGLVAAPPALAVDWTGAMDANWDTVGNWSSGAKPGLGDAVVFPSTVPPTGPVITLTSGEQANSLTFNNAYTLTGGDLTFGTNQTINVGTGFSATIASSMLDGSGGSGYLKKTGSGTLILTGDNTGYTRWMDVAAGVVSLRSSNGVTGGYFHVYAPGAVHIQDNISTPSGKTIYLSNTATDANPQFRSVSGDNVWGGTVALHVGAGDKHIGVDAGSSLTIAGVVSGASDRNLLKVGDGLLVLANNNTHSGRTRPWAGTLRLDSSGALQQSILDMDAADSGSVVFGSPTAFTLGGLMGSRNLDMAGKTLNIGRNASETTTYSGQLSNGALVKIGTNTLALSNANTYTGGTTINGGTISVTGTGVGGSPNFSVNALGPSGSSVVVNSGGALTLTNVVSNWAGANYIYSGAGTINLVSSGGSSYSQVNGSLSGFTGTLNVSGNGYNYLGSATNVSNGTVNVTTTGYGLFFQSGASAQFGALTGNGNIKGGASSGNATLSVGTLNTSTTFSGIIGGGTTVLSLTKVGTGTLTLSGANTYTGTTNVNQGALNIQHNSALGSAAAGTIVASGGQLQLQNNITVTGESLELNGGTALRNVSGDNTWTGPVVVNSYSTFSIDAGSLNISGPMSGNSRINKVGAGTLILSGDNSAYTGNYMDVMGGVVRLRSNTAPIGGYFHVTNASAAVELDGGITAGSGKIIYLSGTATTDDPSLRSTNGNNTWAGNVVLHNETGDHNVGVDAGSTLTILGTISQTGSDPDNLVKVGAGTLVMRGNGTYNGYTRIKAGTLALSGTATLTNSPKITLDAGATFDVSGVTGGYTLPNGRTLEGYGTVVGPLTLGGTHAPGTSIGVMTVSGDYTLAAPGTLQIELGGPDGPGVHPTGHDQLVVTGGLVTLAGTLDLMLGYAPGVGDQFVILDNDGTDAILGHFAGLPEGAVIQGNFGGYNYPFILTYRGYTGNDVVLTAVPEPATLALAVLAVGGMLGRLVRRRRR